MALNLTAADVAEVTGVLPSTLRSWGDKGIIVPVAGGDGHGRHRMYSFTQAVGVSVAAKILRSERGCVTSYVALVVAGFAATTEGELERKFAKGATHLAVMHQGRPILQGEEPGWVDVQQTYLEVKAAVEAIAAREALKPVTGRTRGLATNPKD